MRLLRFEIAAGAADALGEALDTCLPVTLIVAHDVLGEPDKDGNMPIIAPRENLPGYWLLSDAPDLSGDVATLDAGQIVETSELAIIGCWLSPVPAGWPVEPLAMADTPAVAPEPIPGPLTARRLRLGLVAHGFSTAQVAEAIAAIPDPAMREVAEIEWEYATTFDRDHPLIAQVGNALGLTPTDIDAMWLASADL